uniref:Uncharacterized protein n=1 Tax=Anguilla anguilla TaxID=7936 RepID=A0A0E9VNF9_ANGAN
MVTVCLKLEIFIFLKRFTEWQFGPR